MLWLFILGPAIIVVPFLVFYYIIKFAVRQGAYEAIQRWHDELVEEQENENCSK